jgi:hypothetical protein
MGKIRHRGTNRYGVMVRFNTQEQVQLQEIMDFWNKKFHADERDIIKFAIKQLYQSTQQVKAKMEKDERNESDTKIVGEPGSDTPASEPAVVASADAAPTDDTVRDESNQLSEAVAGA